VSVCANKLLKALNDMEAWHVCLCLCLCLCLAKRFGIFVFVFINV